MSSVLHHNPFGNRQSRHKSQSNRRAQGHRVLAWVVAVALLAAALLSIRYAIHSSAQVAMTDGPSRLIAPHATPTRPADRFIESIVTDDGALGWQQLCPNLQAELPVGDLVQQANTQRTLMARQGIHLTVKFVGAIPQPGGGEVRNYAMTAHWPNGATQMRTFSVLTQSSGCVENVTNH
jgi:hypothetical protein